MWLTILGAAASPIFVPLTAVLVSGMGWRDTVRVLAASAAAVFLAMAVLQRGGRSDPPVRHIPVSVSGALREAWRVSGLSALGAGVVDQRAAVDAILVYQVPVMIAAGLPLGAAATIGGLRGFAQLGGRIPLFPLLHPSAPGGRSCCR